jgi:ribose/xylose/arabinose/galactoside ABC-type transport system permease subunit
VVGEIDLSFGAMYGLGANSLAVMWILLGIPIYAALPLAIGVAALVGLFNGALVTWLRIPSFIVTLGTYNLLYGVSLWITKTSTFNPVYPPPGAEIPPAQLDFFTGLTASFGAHPISLEVVWMLWLALVIGFLLHRTLFGFRLMAIGGNPVAAQLARLPVTRYKILAFVICSMLAAVAGILDFSFIQTTQPNIGLSYTFPVFAAVIIGGASLSGGKGTVIGAMSGALLLAELQQGLALLSPGPHVQQLFLGFVTIGAVALDLALTNLRKRRAA